MLSRYKMYRGTRPADDPMPDGIRQDTRKHTRHCLRPPAELVVEFHEKPSESAWRKLIRDYRAELERRFKADRTPFDALADLASREDVYLGCSCPSGQNPVPGQCHTYEALAFMKEKYPGLTVQVAKRIRQSSGNRK